MIIKHIVDTERIDIVEDLGISESVYQGYIDNECEIDALMNDDRTTLDWLCDIFCV